MSSSAAVDGHVMDCLLLTSNQHVKMLPIFHRKVQQLPAMALDAGGCAIAGAFKHGNGMDGIRHLSGLLHLLLHVVSCRPAT